LDIASECCNGRLLFCLEGGYNLTGLSEGVAAVIKECTGRSILNTEERARLDQARDLADTAQQAAETHGRYWTL